MQESLIEETITHFKAPFERILNAQVGAMYKHMSQPFWCKKMVEYIKMTIESRRTKTQNGETGHLSLPE